MDSLIPANYIDGFTKYVDNRLNMSDDYQIFLRVLKKSGFKDFKDYWKTVFDSVVFDKEKLHMFLKRPDASKGSEFIKEAAQFTYRGDVYRVDRAKLEKGFNKKPKKSLSKISKKEQTVADKVFKIVLKLNVDYFMYDDPNDNLKFKKSFFKPFMSELFKEFNSTHNKVTSIPNEVINYVDSIKAAEFDKLLVEQEQAQQQATKNFLNQLEQKLMLSQLIKSNSNFISLVFNNSSLKKIKKCNFLGNQSALIYLIYLLNKKQAEVQSLRISIYQFTSERFTIRGKNVTVKQLSSSFSNIYKKYLSGKNGKQVSTKMLQIVDIVNSLEK